MSFLSNVVGGGGDGMATFFEMAMVYQGNLSLYPAFLQVVQAVRDNFPGSRTANATHAVARELFGGLRFLGESYFLSQHSAGALEMLYGLRRANTKPVQRYHPQNVYLGYNQYVASLFELVLFPYLEVRMDEIYERAKSCHQVVYPKGDEKEEADASQAYSRTSAVRQIFVILRRTSCRLRAKFVHVYPLLRKYVHILRAAYQLMFALGRIRSFSPWQHLCGYCIVRTPPSISGDPMVLSTIPSPSKALVEKLSDWSKSAFYYGVITSVLAFKFFEWWYSTPVQMIAQTSSEEPTALPPPSQVCRSHTAQVTSPRKENICGICSDVCVNMAASPSGYVYCYPCLYAFIKEYGLTPKGRLPCTVDMIRKIWLP